MSAEMSKYNISSHIETAIEKSSYARGAHAYLLATDVADDLVEIFKIYYRDEKLNTLSTQALSYSISIVDEDIRMHKVHDNLPKQLFLLSMIVTGVFAVVFPVWTIVFPLLALVGSVGWSYERQSHRRDLLTHRHKRSVLSEQFNKAFAEENETQIKEIHA